LPRISAWIRRARNAIKQAGVQAVELSDGIEITPGKISIGRMYLAKGAGIPIRCRQGL
jgi:hypothetical protein